MLAANRILDIGPGPGEHGGRLVFQGSPAAMLADTGSLTGDYLAGPNHVLPTMGTARFSSALGVETFIKKSSLIAYSSEALLGDSDDIQKLANLEAVLHKLLNSIEKGRDQFKNTLSSGK